MRKKLRFLRTPMEQKFIDADLSKIRARIDEEKFVELSTRDRTMTMEEAVAFALEGTSE